MPLELVNGDFRHGRTPVNLVDKEAEESQVRVPAITNLIDEPDRMYKALDGE